MVPSVKRTGTSMAETDADRAISTMTGNQRLMTGPIDGIRGQSYISGAMAARSRIYSCAVTSPSSLAILRK